MDKRQVKPFFYIILFIFVLSLILILFFVPDMSSTLVNTIPEHPPQISTINANEALITDAVVIDRTNAKAIISAMKRPDEYFSETQSIITHNSGSSTFTRKKWVKGDLARVDVMTDSSRVSAHYIYAKENVYIFSDTSRTYYKTARGNFSPDDAQMLMSYEDICTAQNDLILDAGLTTLEGSSCIWVKVKNPDTGNTTQYWVSTSTGLLVYGETLDEAGKTIYTLSSKQTDISEQNADIFTLPDNSKPT